MGSETEARPRRFAIRVLRSARRLRVRNSSWSASTSAARGGRIARGRAEERVEARRARSRASARIARSSSQAGEVVGGQHLAPAPRRAPGRAGRPGPARAPMALAPSGPGLGGVERRRRARRRGAAAGARTSTIRAPARREPGQRRLEGARRARPPAPSITTSRSTPRVAPCERGAREVHARPAQRLPDQGRVLDVARERPRRCRRTGRAAPRPSRGSAPWAGLKPTRSFQAAGRRIEPPVSEPIGRGREAPGHRGRRARGGAAGQAVGVVRLGGVAVAGLRPRPEKANSVMWVLPRQTVPRVRRRARAPRRPASGTRPARSEVPASVADAGRVEEVLPGERHAVERARAACPALARARAASASARARSGVVRA